MKIEKLSEKNLADVLRFLFPGEELHSQFNIDLGFQKARIDYRIKNYLVEFDGPLHYQITKKQIRDRGVAAYCRENELKYVRVPYFVQLEPEMIGHLFPYNYFHVLPESMYESGFRDPKIVYPCDYNLAGMRLFEQQMCEFPEVIRNKIAATLTYHQRYGE
jgi:hypothetical protein